MKIIQKVCKTHGETKFVFQNRGYYRCSKCMNEQSIRSRVNKKKRLVNFFGGKCIRCGYNKTCKALQFHHRNPKEKNFSIGAKGMSYSFDFLLEEAQKCDLLCANCHVEAEEERYMGL